MRAVFVLLVTLLATSCGPGTPEPASADDQGQTTPAAPAWPTSRWPMSTPEAEGLDSAALGTLDTEFAAGDHGYIDSMLIVKNGHVVFERAYTHDYDELFEGVEDQTPGPYNYYDPAWHPYYEHGPLHTMQSVSKSVTSALIGIAIGRGEIPGVDVKALPYFREFSLDDPDPRWEALTLEHLLTMTAGIAWDESTVVYTDPANTCAGMERSDDWVQFVLDQPMTDDPGARFVYNSGATVLLAQVIKEATGLEAHEYAAAHLFGPLGITSCTTGCGTASGCSRRAGSRHRPAHSSTPPSGRTANGGTATSGGSSPTGTRPNPRSPRPRSVWVVSCSSWCPSSD